MRPLSALLFALLWAVSAQSQGGAPALEAALTVPRFVSEAYEYFGTTLAMEGDYAAASGEKLNRPGTGVVHVLHWSGARWTIRQEIAPLLGEEARFGADIAMEGGLLFVGAPGNQYAPTTPAGSVYVYGLAGDEWVLSSVIYPPGPAGPDLFGESLDFDGERLIVGAPNRLTARGAGAVYVYERVGTTWALADSLTSPFDRSLNFGTSVAIDGMHAAVTDNDDQGDVRANTYRRGAEGQWTWDGDLAREGEQFWRPNCPMALDEGRLAAGSPRYATFEGAVQVYEYREDGWIRTARLRDDAGLSARFGSSVALDGDRLVAGAPVISAGRALVYELHGGTWTRTAVLTPPQLPPGSHPGNDLGAAVALDGNRVLVGAPWTSVEEHTRAGTVVAFEERPDGWARTTNVPVGYTWSRIQFGADVALAEGRLAVGAPRGVAWGSVHVYSVGADGPTFEARLSEGYVLGYGAAVAIGSDQVMVGAAGQEGENRVFVYSRGDTGWALAQTLSGPASFGAAIALDGDRAIVGAPGAFDTPSGQAFLYERAGGVWELVATLLPQIPEDVPDDGRTFGSSVALDGTRAVVGAPGAVMDSLALGAVYVFQSDGGTWEPEATLTVGGPDEGFGASVAASGGIVLATRIGSDGGTGTAYVFEESGWTPTAALSGPSQSFGADVALDGPRIVVGSPSEDGQRGRAYVYGSDGHGWTLMDTVEGPAAGVGLGTSVAVDGHRYVVGAPSTATNEPGSVYVYRDSTAVTVEAGPTAGTARLFAPRPNPASQTSHLVLSVGRMERVTATVYDALGRSVQTVLNGEQLAGEVMLTIDAGRLAPGVYVVRVTGETFVESQSLVVVR